MHPGPSSASAFRYPLSSSRTSLRALRLLSARRAVTAAQLPGRRPARVTAQPVQLAPDSERRSQTCFLRLRLHLHVHQIGPVEPLLRHSSLADDPQESLPNRYSWLLTPNDAASRAS